MDRVIVFIDGSNLYFGCKDSQVKAPWDMAALGSALSGPQRKLIRVYYYNARCRKKDVPAERYDAEQKFYDSLRRLDYCTVRLGRLEGVKGRVHQKGVDVLLVQDLLTLAFTDAFDVAILVSNDGDYASVLNELKAGASRSRWRSSGSRPTICAMSATSTSTCSSSFPGSFRRPDEKAVQAPAAG